MEKIKKIGRSTKKFVEDHKVGIAVICTAAVLIKVNRMALKDHDDFLKDHDLYEKFYSIEL
jgi:hypothetical protein